MIREVIYKLVRKSTSLRKKKKKKRKKKKETKFPLPPCSFHVRAPGRTPRFIIWFFLKCPVMMRSSAIFPQGPPQPVWGTCFCGDT